MGWLRASRRAGSYDLAADVPAERLAHLLRRARVRAGLEDRALARLLGVRPKVVAGWEDGTDRPDDDALCRFAAACGIDVDTLLRRRDVVEVDRATGTMRVGTSAVRFDWSRTSNAMVLHTYAGLVREQRGLRPDQPVRFRDDDIEALAQALDLTDAELEARFVQIIGLSPQEAADVRRRMVGRRLAVPAAAGVLVAALVPGAAATARNAPPAVTVSAPTTAATSTPPSTLPPSSLPPSTVAPAATAPGVAGVPVLPDVVFPPPTPPVTHAVVTHAPGARPAGPAPTSAPTTPPSPPPAPPPTIGTPLVVTNPAISSAPPRAPSSPPTSPPTSPPPTAPVVGPPATVVNPDVGAAPPRSAP
jgi:hypothetical protein